MHCRDVAVGQLLNAFAALVSAGDDFVINIRNITDVFHLIALRPEPAIDHIEYHHHTGVAQVTEVVNGHATDVHAHLPRMNRLQRGFFAGQGVIDREHDGL